MKDKVRMIGYNAKGQAVYADCLDTGDFYDGEHVWDRADSALALNLVKVVGERFDSDGELLQRWETAFSAETGMNVGLRTIDAAGNVSASGVYKNT